MKINPIALALLALGLLAAPPLAAAKVLRTASPREPLSLDPAQVWDDTSSFFIANTFDTLVAIDPQTLAIVPALARTWQNSRDGRTWTFDLRPGVRFHDDTPCDAAAVAFSFQRQMGANRRERFPMFSEIFPFLKQVEASGPLQVRFTLSEPYATFLAALTIECAAIVSPRAVRESGEDFGRRPVGSGPFQLSSWQPGRRLTLVANRRYWRGRPAIDEVVVAIEPQAAAMDRAFQEGQLDFLTTYSISRLIAYRKQDWVHIRSMPIFSVTYVVLNASRPKLKSATVRQALCHAWDPRALKLVFQDHVLPIHSLLPSGLGGDPQAPVALPFSLERARQLLAGDAANLELELLVQEEGLLLQLLTLYARNLQQVGVKLKLTRLTGDAYARRVRQGDFDLACSGWVADFPDPDSMLAPLFSPKLQQQGFANAAVCQRLELLQRLLRVRHERDAKKRYAEYRTIDRVILGEGLILPLYQDQRVIVANRRVAGLRTSPMGRLFLGEVTLQ